MASSRPFFSVVVPVYNKASCLKRSIKSILAQTFGDFELLLVNDASTDESLNEIHKFSDSRIRLLHRDVPGPGGYAARNLGIAESRADWVAFLDADDEWYPEHLEVLRGLILESQGGVVASGWLRDCGDEGLRPNTFAKFHAGSTRKTLDFRGFLNETANGRTPMWTGSVAVRLELLQKVGGFPEHCRKGGDTAVWLQLMNTAGELVASTRPTAIYHRADSFVTATIPPEVKNNCVYSACCVLLQESSNKRVSRLLKRVSNKHVSYGLRKRAREGSLRFSDCNAHYFTVNWRDHVLFRLHGLLPRWAQLAAKSVLLTARGAMTSLLAPWGSSPS